MSSIANFMIHPNKQWFDTDEQAVLDDFADPDTVTFLLRQHGRFQVKLPVNQEVIIGRGHSGKGTQPQVDLSPYNAEACGTSRLHAALRHDSHGWWLEDLQSANGTWVNGEALQAYCPVHLEVRNQILLGNLPLTILLPHRVFAGVVIPINFDQTTPTHVVNIEGDPALQRILQVTFQAAEPTINLHHFATGDQAMPYIMANAQTIDLFILNIALPGTMNGLEVASQIRALGCPGSIVFTSEDASPSGETLDSLNSGFLPKPSHILEIAPRLFNYRLTVKIRPERRTESPIEREDPFTIQNRQQKKAAAAVASRVPDVQEVSEADETQPPAVAPDATKPKRFKVPLDYVLRVMATIRRL